MSQSSKDNNRQKPQSIITATDRAELERHYEFVPGPTNTPAASWQERMVQTYHQHLYKEYVLADFSRKPTALGLRWRTKPEVQSGRGSTSCGNKHCPAACNIHADDENEYRKILTNAGAIARIPYGMLQQDFEVPFSYREGSTKKKELVKLRLCLRCSVYLVECRKISNPLEGAYQLWMDGNGKSDSDDDDDDDDDDDANQSETKEEERNDDCEESSSASIHRRHRKRKSSKLHKKKKRKRRLT